MKFPSLTDRLHMALEEDGAFEDVTTLHLGKAGLEKAKGVILAKGAGVFCGAFLLKPIFHFLDPRAKIRVFKKDGSTIQKGDKLAVVASNARTLLSGERLFLNLCGHLSGVATLTRTYVNQVKGTTTIIQDTRKTNPLWRDLERIAVQAGGGVNHRFSLRHAVMVKDNHLQFMHAHGMSAAELFHIDRFRHAKRKKHIEFVEFEAQSLKDVWDGIKAQADVIMLDNMDQPMLIKSLALIRSARRVSKSPKPYVEVSGKVSLEDAKRLSQLGVDRISVGALTHSAPVVDISMEVNEWHIQN